MTREASDAGCLALALLFGLLLMGWAMQARAETCRETRPAERQLACIAAREEGINARRWIRRARELHVPPEDAARHGFAAVMWAAKNRATALHRPLRQHLHHFLGDRSYRTRPWTGTLRPDRLWSRRPLLWPRRCSGPPGDLRCVFLASWRLSRPFWRIALEVGVGVESGVIPDPCPRTPSPAEHWGAPIGIDDERAERAMAAGRWAPVDCGEVPRNRLYRIKARMR